MTGGKFRNAFVDGHVGQEAVHVAFRQLPRMWVIMELDRPTNPVDGHLFRAATVVAHLENFDSAVEWGGIGESGNKPNAECRWYVAMLIAERSLKKSTKASFFTGWQMPCQAKFLIFTELPHRTQN